ncbi:isochorismatase family protein [Paucibacter sp. R3-3]|uniref:Isochorismatase family protein n=1 Tax=Roseateles agri TaxID=3098619 RepID=A0ABU5DL80_9BURK|nr:isochorismatase family protein [Paucibacter sp. R3-3]MDY0746491.1 isochorismatase family protein [Paucibacter sp. R3-3]
MPITSLDAKTALVVIDMQKGIVSLPLAQPVEPIIAKVAELARAFRAAGQPVVLVNVAGRAPGRNQQPGGFTPPPDWAVLIPELEQQADDHLVTKLQLGAFVGTSLEQFLRRGGITQVVMCGIATSIGVESTARQAYDLGFNVAFAVDAMNDLNGEAQHNSIERIFPRIGELGSTADVIALLG